MLLIIDYYVLNFCIKWFYIDVFFEKDVCFFFNIIFLKVLFMLIYVYLCGLLILVGVVFLL